MGGTLAIDRIDRKDSIDTIDRIDEIDMVHIQDRLYIKNISVFSDLQVIINGLGECFSSLYIRLSLSFIIIL